jgi:hypothetical protein
MLNVSKLGASNITCTNTTVTNLSIPDSYIGTCSTSTSSLSGFVNNSSAAYIIVFAGTAQSIGQGTVTNVNSYWTGGASTSSGISNSSGTFKVTNAGTYLVTFNFAWNAGTNSGGRGVWCVINGGNPRYSEIDQNPTGIDSCNGCFYVTLNANDTISMQCYQNSGGTITLDPTRGARFTMVQMF